MAAQLVDADADDKLALRHVETFNILCAGESGLGKSTFLRDIFAHLDPSKLHDLKRRVAEAAADVRSLDDELQRNEKESRLSDDQRTLELLASREDVRRRAAEARTHLDKEQQCLNEHRQTVIKLRGEIEELKARLTELRATRDAEDDDAEAQRIARDVIGLSEELSQREATLRVELLRSSLDERRGETTTINARLIENMPLYDGADVGLDVTLIDTPGTGGLLVDIPSHSSADLVVAEVERRIGRHLSKERAERADTSLDDERKYYNGLVHLCLFFITPHRMKRVDVDLMRRLHALVPLVVVIAKSDTMTVVEAREFKAEVSAQLQKEGIETFTFDQKTIRAVEQRHVEMCGLFEPMYGGSDGRLPWAVMGADESRREYLWGTADTSNPMHSELPALRDLCLRAGGWQTLKRAAAIKADAEGLRRKKVAAQESRWSRMRKPLAAIPRGSILTVVLTAALTSVTLTGASAVTQRVQLAEATVVSSTTELARLRHEYRLLQVDLIQCTEVREALQSDYDTCQADQSSATASQATGGDVATLRELRVLRWRKSHS